VWEERGLEGSKRGLCAVCMVCVFCVVVLWLLCDVLSAAEVGLSVV
jgi:hypothetical protein